VTETLEYDASGLLCPLPVLRANRKLRELPVGGELTVRATDPAAEQDFSRVLQADRGTSWFSSRRERRCVDLCDPKALNHLPSGSGRDDGNREKECMPKVSFKTIDSVEVSGKARAGARRPQRADEERPGDRRDAHSSAPRRRSPSLPPRAPR